MTQLFAFKLFRVLYSTLAIGWCLATSIDHRLAHTPLAARDLGFSASEWIWTATTVPGATRALRKDFTPPFGKSLVAADIVIAANSAATLFVNGELAGTSNANRYARRLCVSLLPSFNVFAINATTGSTTTGAVLAAIQVTYSDGTTDMLVTDASWRVSNTSPAGFEQLSFDDTAWPLATIFGPYGVAPFTTVFIPTTPPSVSLDNAHWIWTTGVPTSGLVPSGPRAFRRTFTLMPGEVPASTTIIITADDAYTLYVNGVLIGSGGNSKLAQHYTVNLQPAPTLVVAVLATNTGAAPSSAGVLASIEINMAPTGRANCIAGALLLSDGQWKSSTDAVIPASFQLPGFDDSAWPAVALQAAYPLAPWGTVTIAPPSPPISA
ncbi:hypothetical protein DFH09DRAFT_1374198 [Mycena vulgaris]|nr:hypothetical protein DFH09DRAFT_1374198 [Mycena vulgaris]